MVDEHLLRFNKKQKYLIFDSETSSLNLVWKQNLPWQWAWQLRTLDEVLEERDYLINWDKAGIKLKVGDGAARVTGFYAIQHEIYSRGKHPQEVLDELENHLYNPEILVVAHSGLQFDQYIHKIHRAVLGKKPDYSYVSRFLDTSLLARAWKAGIPFPTDRKDLESFQWKMSSNIIKGVKTSIMALCQDLDVPYDASLAHNALVDIRLLAEIFKKLLFKIEI